MHESFQIFECIPPWIKWQQDQRKAGSLNQEILAGVNLSIILAAACFIEGNLERILLKTIDTVGVQSNPLLIRLIDDLRTKVSKTTGSKGYNEVFGLVVGEKVNEFINDSSLWENIKTLFFFRNVIAHGRAVGYKLYFPPKVGGFWEEEFSGGYKKVEDFLLKKGLISSRHIEEADNWHYFSNEVADFFWEAAMKFVSRLNEIALPSSKS